MSYAKKTIELNSILQKTPEIVIDNYNTIDNNAVSIRVVKELENKIYKEIKSFKRQTKSKQWKSVIKKRRR